MTQSGGAGTHYGILYQTLSTIDAAFTIDSRGDELDPETVTLIVEPRGGGGDVVASTARRRPVFQFKARGDHGTWSLNEIIDDALSDLYRAVPPEPDSCSEYLLVTEGREGDVEEARAFFRELNRYCVPDDPLRVLEDTDLRQYFPSGSPTSRRKFFDHITRRLCRTSEDGEPVLSEYRRVWSLLSRFDILREVFEDVEQRVEQWLLAYVDAPEDVRPKADELCGTLLKLAAKGNQTLTLRSLLSRAGLPTMSLAELPAARVTAKDRIAINLKRLSIDPSKIVQRSTTFGSQRIFCLAGESGSGKTTMMAQIAIECAESDVVVFVSKRSGIDFALQQAADEIWKPVLGHGRSLDWESLARQARRVGLADAEPWITLFLDITAGAGEVDRLLRLEWAEWNVRLIFTADEMAGKKIREDASLAALCEVQFLGELSFDERYELLKKRGRSIAEIPADVIALLARPILADVYCRVTKDVRWRPSNEYQVFDAFWREAEAGREGNRYRHNTSVLLRLAERLLNNAGAYPWPIDVLDADFIDDTALQRLIEKGWLRELGDGDIEFAHERFANWAVARAIGERIRRGYWTAEHLAAYLDDIYLDEPNARRSYCGYVPMDALWLIAQHEKNVALLADTITALRHRDWGGFASVGAPIVPALHRVMKAEASDSEVRDEISDCVSRIAARDPIPEEYVSEWLNDDAEDIHEIGLAVARMQPQAGSLDRLWHLQREAGAISDKDTQAHWKHDRALRAAVMAARANPEWICAAAGATDSVEELRTLAWMLSMIGDERGASLWRGLKQRFLDAIGAEGARGALQCIDRYDDRSEIDTLAAWIETGGNFVPPESLAALAAMDSDRAFRVFENHPLDRLESLADFWLPPLRLSDAARVRTAIHARFDDGTLSPAWLHWELRGEYQADPPLIASVIERATQLMAQALDAPKPDRPPVEIKHLLATLAAVNHLEGLKALCDEANAEFATSLVRLAERYTPHDSSTLDRWFVRQIQQVLLRIGGEALAAFVILQLRNPGDWPRADIRSAVTSPSKEAVRLLIHLAEMSPSGNDENFRSMDALRAIASLGERGTVLRLLETKDHLWLDDELYTLLKNAAPIGDEQLARIVNRDKAKTESRIRRFHLLGVTARPDVILQLIDEVVAEPNEDVKRAAFHAIQILADPSVPIAEAVKIGFDREPEVLARLLCAIGTDAALDELERHLLERDGAQISDDLISIAAWLVNCRQRNALGRVVWQFIQVPGRHFRVEMGSLYRAVGGLALPKAIELLHAVAFGTDPDDRIGAIRGLASQRPQAAFDAAAAALGSSEPDRGQYAGLLVDINGEAAIGSLCDRLTVERMEPQRAYICRALRRMQSDGQVRQRVSALMSSADPVERAAGCQAAGWLDAFEDERLRMTALRDPDPMARAFALNAVRMHRHNERVADLLAALRAATGDRAWALLQMVLDSASPLVLAQRHDPLSLEAVLEGKPPAMMRYAQDRIDNYFKNEGRKAEDVFEDFYR